jgi:cyclopropane-fatty-acyl-phospholipid synthase
MAQLRPRQSHLPQAVAPAAGNDPAVAIAQSILYDLFGPAPLRTFSVRYWEGTTETPATGRSDCTLVLRRPGALRRMLVPPSEIALGEAYLRDDFDVEGSLEAAVALADSLVEPLESVRQAGSLLRRLLTLPTTDRPDTLHSRRPPARNGWGMRHTRARDAAAVRSHYDVGNDFYALWLDARMAYSCAYFRSGSEDLDKAQEDKLEHLCRKLRLRPDERLLDIGCGWGSLAIYAAQHFGVQVLGVTLSEPQAAFARERVTAAGLEDRCRIEVRDYRDLDGRGPFDKVVSVGMFEHVGRAQLRRYFATVYGLTRPGGLFLNHGIAESARRPLPWRTRWTERLLLRSGSFVQTYVFPDGELIPPGETIRVAEDAGFETRDVENLREHYTRTLRHWVHRLEAAHTEAARLVGERTYRVWRFYMSGAARAFATNTNQLIQALYSRPNADGTSEVPLTRADLYR